MLCNQLTVFAAVDVECGKRKSEGHARNIRVQGKKSSEFFFALLGPHLKDSVSVHCVTHLQNKQSLRICAII